jgi:hypothetical protein
MDRNTKMAGTALVFLLLATLQGCHCWGWYHYHNCYVYLGTPPGAKTYGHPLFAPGWYSGWPYGYTSPACGSRNRRAAIGNGNCPYAARLS